MDIRRLFTQQLNFRYVNQLVDSGLFDGLSPTEDGAIRKPVDARVMFEGKGVQVLRITLNPMRGDIEKSCIRLLRKHYPDAVYLFADTTGDTGNTSYHLCNDAGKQLVLTPEKQRLFTEKVAFFEVTDDVTGTLDLKERIAKAFGTEKITKKFFTEFRKYRDLLVKFIQGIKLDEDKNWYASVLLNRLMFIYFIQKRGFIGGKQDWLRDQLTNYEQSGTNYYAGFLKPLFFNGFAQAKGSRGTYEVGFSDVPYLNGGLFQRHVIEERCPDISVDNKVIRQLLDYFNKYQWYLDDRPLRKEDEINPDVLGYIFEKYVNGITATQKQMGAYYTQEDITGYICKNTILPFLLDKLARLQGQWQPEGAPLPLAITPANIERYVYEAVQTEDYLTTETEREYQARRKRFRQIQQDATSGKITTINDLITYNLDIVTYTDDAISEMDERAMMRFYFECLQKVSILDPTAGSGAFLFAALNTLLPLYLACIRKIRGFVAGKPQAGYATEYDRFSTELRRISTHDNERYYIVKSIIVNNLYGVDIMEEATEICKLRLFLRLAAEIKDPAKIEPLPDIDFNVKAGNSLVGFATRDEVERALTTQLHGEGVQGKLVFGDTSSALAEVERKCKLADQAYQRFHQLQTDVGIPANMLADAKHELRADLRELNDTLNRALAREYGVALPNEKAEAKTAAGRKGKASLNTLAENSAYTKWLSSHQPFHWFAEFYGILSNGGFDVIVGNPPWKEYSAVKKDYILQGYRTESCGNLYGFCFERVYGLCASRSSISFIVQLPLMSSSRMNVVRDLLRENSELLIVVPFGDRPDKLFDGLEHARSTVVISRPDRLGSLKRVYTANYQRWYTVERGHLFEKLELTQLPVAHYARGIFPKYKCSTEVLLFEKLYSCSDGPFSATTTSSATSTYIFYQEATEYWIKATVGLPHYTNNGIAGPPPHGRYLYFETEDGTYAMCALMYSSLFFMYFVAQSDCFHLSDNLVLTFPIKTRLIADKQLNTLGRKLMHSLKNEAVGKTIATKDESVITYSEFYAWKSKPVIDEIDRVLAKYYDFTDQELDFIINYEIKYRMGQSNSVEVGKYGEM